MHRDPSVLPHKPSERICRKRQSLWWWILYVDTCFSIALGRPLGISAQGDCRPVDPLIQDSTVPLSMSTIFAKFTILYRQILTVDHLSNSKIDHFTKLLLEYLFSLPTSLQFSPQWLESHDVVPSSPTSVQAIFICMQVNTYLVLLNRQWQHQKQEPAVASCRSKRRPVAYSRVISSCRAILQAYLYLNQSASKAPANWSINQSAYNAALILATHLVETDDSDRDFEIMRDVYVIFEALADRDHQYGRPAGLAEKMRKSLRPYLTGQTSDNGTAISDSIKREEVLSEYGMILAEDPGLLDHISSNGGYGILDQQMADIDGSGDLIITPQSQQQARKISPLKNQDGISPKQPEEAVSCQTASKDRQTRSEDQKTAKKRKRDVVRDEPTSQVGGSKRHKHRDQKKPLKPSHPIPSPPPAKMRKTSKHISNSSSRKSKPTTKYSTTHKELANTLSQASTEKKVANVLAMTPPEPSKNTATTVDTSTGAAVMTNKDINPSHTPPNRQLPNTTRTTPHSFCEPDPTTYLPTAPTTNATTTAAEFAAAYDYFSVPIPIPGQLQSDDDCTAVLTRDFAPESHLLLGTPISAPQQQQQAFNPTILHGIDGIMQLQQQQHLLTTHLYPIASTTTGVPPPSAFFPDPPPALAVPMSSTPDVSGQWHQQHQQQQRDQEFLLQQFHHHHHHQQQRGWSAASANW